MLPGLHDFLKPEDITPEYLDGVIDESEPRQEAILSLVDLEPHDTSEIPVKVYVHQEDRHASIVGFADRYIRLRGQKIEEMRVSPFTVKNAKVFTVNDDELEIDTNGMPMVSREGVVDATNFLERARRNLMVWAILSMINEAQFVYNDGERTLDIPFTEQIIDSTADGVEDPSKEFTANDFNAQKEYRLMKERYFRLTGQIPDLMLFSGITAAEVADANGIDVTIKPGDSSDPERGAETYDEFEFAGITHRVLHAQYPSRDASGNKTLKDAIDEGYGILTVRALQEDGRSPFRVHRASTKLNGNQAQRPFFRSFVESEETRNVAVALDDNFVPGVKKRKVAQKLKLYTA